MGACHGGYGNMLLLDIISTVYLLMTYDYVYVHIFQLLTQGQAMTVAQLQICP